MFQATLRGERFRFADLRELFAKANEEKSGDQLAGIAATSERERVAAKIALADVPVRDVLARPLLDPDEDEVSREIVAQWDEEAARDIPGGTLGELREWVLADDTTEDDLRRASRGWTPEVVAALAKLMGNKDLVMAARKVRHVTRCRNTVGEAGVLAVRVQPNHPVDDVRGIVLAAVDGLLYGCGDAVIGANPATESVESVTAILNALQRLIESTGAPTQACCLAHVTTQLQCLERGTPVDLLFQSIAGTEGANASFGVHAGLLREGRERVVEHHRRRDVAWVGEQVMYFETGQGSALSAEAHAGIDQVTLEARAYGFARAFDPFLVNSVVGFIGPEYLFDERQIVRAGLEDHFMGKLLGLPMGCDVCYTNHVAADQNSADNLLMLLTAAGCNYFMGVPCADDVMLNYQSTSYHDLAAMRSLFGLRPAPEFAAWLDRLGICRQGRLVGDGESSRQALLRMVPN